MEEFLTQSRAVNYADRILQNFLAMMDPKEELLASAALSALAAPVAHR